MTPIFRLRSLQLLTALLLRTDNYDRTTQGLAAVTGTEWRATMESVLRLKRSGLVAVERIARFDKSKRQAIYKLTDAGIDTLTEMLALTLPAVRSSIAAGRMRSLDERPLTMSDSKIFDILNNVRVAGALMLPGGPTTARDIAYALDMRVRSVRNAAENMEALEWLVIHGARPSGAGAVDTRTLVLARYGATGMFSLCMRLSPALESAGKTLDVQVRVPGLNRPWRKLGPAKLYPGSGKAKQAMGFGAFDVLVWLAILPPQQCNPREIALKARISEQASRENLDGHRRHGLVEQIEPGTRLLAGVWQLTRSGHEFVAFRSRQLMNAFTNLPTERKYKRSGGAEPKIRALSIDTLMVMGIVATTQHCRTNVELLERVHEVLPGTQDFHLQKVDDIVKTLRARSWLAESGLTLTPEGNAIARALREVEFNKFERANGASTTALAILAFDSAKDSIQ